MTNKKITWKFLHEHLDWLELCNEGSEKPIDYACISKVGLELAEEIEPDTMDVAVCFGRIQKEYLSRFSKEIIDRKVANVFKAKPPLVILTRSFDYELIKDQAIKYNVPVFKTNISFTKINLLYTSYMMLQLAEEKSIHGNLIEVFGVGILLMGESGLGKSEISLELIEKGHQFISDDVVVYKKILNHIVGASDEKTRGFIEIRGLGIINLTRLFGIKSLKDSCRVDIVVQLEIYDHKKSYERLGEKTEHMEFFDVKIPYYRVPISSGRKVSEIIETIASIQKLKATGYSALDEFRKKFSPPGEY